MAPKKQTVPPEGAAPRGGTPYPAIAVSSFAIVLTAMMFATGVAQKSAMPRIAALKERVLPGKKSPDAAATVPDSTAAPEVSRAWSAASDSVRLLEEQLSIALAEMAGARSGEAAGAAGAAEGAAEPAALDSAGTRDLLRLVKVLDAMKPADAARILDAADEEIAIEAIRRLKERNAGKVLALMQPARAITVGQVLGRAAELPQ